LKVALNHACTGSNTDFNHTGPINALTYSAGAGQYLLSGSSDRSINLYNPSKAISAGNSTTSSFITSSSATATRPSSTPAAKKSAAHPGLIQSYSGPHTHEILSIAVSASNATFLSSGGDRAFFLWDVATAKTVRRFGGGAAGGHAGRVDCVCFGGEDEGVVCSGSYDASVRLWDVKAGAGGGGGGKPMMVLGEARDGVMSVFCRGWEVVAGGVDGRVRTYDIRMGVCYVDVIGGMPVLSTAIRPATCDSNANSTNYTLDPITSLTPSTTDASALLISTLTSTLRLLDRANGTLLKTYTHPSYLNTTYRTRSTFASNDALVLAGSEDGYVYAWDVLTAEMVGRVKHVVEEDEGRVARSGRRLVGALAWRGGERG